MNLEFTIILSLIGIIIGQIFHLIKKDSGLGLSGSLLVGIAGAVGTGFIAGGSDVNRNVEKFINHGALPVILGTVFLLYMISLLKNKK